MSSFLSKLDILLEEFGNGIAIFLDQDETMVYTCHSDMYTIIAGRHGNKGSPEEIIKADGGIMFPPGYFDPNGYQSYNCVFPRPGLEEFLKACLAITPDLYVCTSGSTEFQSKVLELIGVRKYFKDILGKTRTIPGVYSSSDEYSEAPGTYKLKILVDDLDEQMSGLIDKLQRLGDAVHIQCPKWIGPNNSKGDLSGVLNSIKEVINGNLASVSLKSALYRLRTEMAQTAQKVYDDWDDTENSGGICDGVAEAIGGVIANNIPDVELNDWGHDGDDHAAVIAGRKGIQYKVDIPTWVYEKGSGYSWTKKPGVKFTPENIDIREI